MVRHASVRLVRGAIAAALLAGVSLAAALASGSPISQAVAAANPYAATRVEDMDPDPLVLETTIVADEATVDIGPVTARAFTFNGTLPGPEFHLVPGERVIVHFENRLAEPTAIHWHGIELANQADGSPLTQDQVPPGGSYLYDFVAPRPGIYWYHPHHEYSTNHVFKGLYGAIIVTDPNESQLIAAGVLPGSADTMTLTVSDITVCKSPGNNDEETYPWQLPWAGEEELPVQDVPTPADLCDTPRDNHGMVLSKPLRRGAVPNIQLDGPRTNEGQTVLTNGVNVGGRGGAPSAPGALQSGARTRAVRPGQGVRLQIVNAATTRYLRLLLADASGSAIALVRVGGQGGLLDEAVVEGGQPDGFDLRYALGELLLAPGERADVVVAFPDTASGVATLWTQDFQRTGGGDGSGGWTNTPTVPVAHFKLSGAPLAPAYAIAPGTPLRSATGNPQEVLPAPTGTYLDPAALAPPKPGLAAAQTKLTADSEHPSVDDVVGQHDFTLPYSALAHTGSTRYARVGDVLELSVRNTTRASHNFHLHGFSFQPVSFSQCTDQPVNQTYVFPEPEFIDSTDIPGRCTFNYRIRLDDRPLVDGATPGGALGRWMVHCHIFFHHHLGMKSELVVTDANGNERPTLDAAKNMVWADPGEDMEVVGRWSDPDGDAVSLAASSGTLEDHGDGTWTWRMTADGVPGSVVVTATDAAGNRAQAMIMVAPDELPATGGASTPVWPALVLLFVGTAACLIAMRGRGSARA